MSDSNSDLLARADEWLENWKRDGETWHPPVMALIRDLAAALREARAAPGAVLQEAVVETIRRAERAERALADAQKDTEALAYGRNAALKREAEARGQVRDLAIIIDRMERFAWSSEVVKEEADRARATLAGRPARADEGLMPIKRMLTDEQFCRAFCSPRMDGKHVEECTRAEPRPAPACGHGYVRFSDGSCIPCHVEERARADPRPAPAECTCGGPARNTMWAVGNDHAPDCAARAEPRPAPRLDLRRAGKSCTAAGHNPEDHAEPPAPRLRDPWPVQCAGLSGCSTFGHDPACPAAKRGGGQ